jgi:hypothetical protein
MPVRGAGHAVLLPMPLPARSVRRCHGIAGEAPRTAVNLTDTALTTGAVAAPGTVAYGNWPREKSSLPFPRICPGCGLLPADARRDQFARHREC